MQFDPTRAVWRTLAMSAMCAGLLAAAGCSKQSDNTAASSDAGAGSDASGASSAAPASGASGG